MELETAISLLKKTVKENGTSNMKHIDLGLVSAAEKPKYEEALMVVKLAIMKGEMSQEDFKNRINLE